MDDAFLLPFQGAHVSSASEGVTREPQSSTIPTPRFTRNHKAWNPKHPAGGTYSHNCTMENPRCSISELHIGKFLDSVDFQCWKSQLQGRSVCKHTLSCAHNVVGQRSGDSKLNVRSCDVAVN